MVDTDTNQLKASAEEAAADAAAAMLAAMVMATARVKTITMIR